jgi:L-fucose isomerase-like protein
MSIGVLTLLFKIGAFTQDLNSRAFDSTEQKQEVLRVADEHMSEIEVYKHINRISVLEEHQEQMVKQIETLEFTIQGLITAINDLKVEIEKKKQ